MLAFGLAACSGGGALHRLGSGARVPDDFSVLPMRPLVIPDTLALPAPGGTNLADPDPVGAAMALLGGRDGAGVAGDAALLAQLGTWRTDPDIRATVAQEDAAFRSRTGRGGRGLSARDPYYAAYARQSLDPWAEIARFRAAGVATPTAPPRR
ncbi:MAG: DUF3035 domain-containing protein [Rubellimicrobium sp.]|nr:DUF3035 domain-containing protein [Rubellimicrobium sp.]